MAKKKPTRRTEKPRRDEIKAASRIAEASDGPAQPGIDVHRIGGRTELEISPACTHRDGYGPTLLDGICMLCGSEPGRFEVIAGSDPESGVEVEISTDGDDCNADFGMPPPSVVPVRLSEYARNPGDLEP